MELVLYVFFNVIILAIMLIGLKYNPFICILAGFVGVLTTISLINDDLIHDSLSGFTTTAWPSAWIPILLMIANFLLPFERLGRHKK